MAPRGRSSRRATELQQEALDAERRPVTLTCGFCGDVGRMARLATREETQEAGLRLLNDHLNKCEGASDAVDQPD